MIQTTASAGQAVAGGVVYCVPALIIIHYWMHFPYWQTVLISFLGGALGVLFSVPIRHALVSDEKLTFPEGRAIAEVLKAGSQKTAGLVHMVLGGLIGAGFEFISTGLKLMANQVQYWVNYSGNCLWF